MATVKTSSSGSYNPHPRDTIVLGLFVYPQWRIQCAWTGALARGHQFADGFEHDAKLLVVLLLQFIQTSREVSMRGEHCPKPHESPHNRNVHFNCALAV